MRAPLLIIGQGLAGTLLGHACERAGLEFRIADAGHEGAASRVGAGIINPVTGRRIVKSREVDVLREPALRVYRELETVLGVSLVREMRVRRLFRNDEERRMFDGKRTSGELAPYVNGRDESGFWIEQAARVDTAALIRAARARWLAAGVLEETRVESSRALEIYQRVVLCTGATGGVQGWGGAPCALASGHILRVAAEGLDPTVIINRGHWVLPVAAGEARLGATYIRDGEAGSPEGMAQARVELERSAGEMLATFTSTGLESGWRVTTPDRFPIVGWADVEARVGVFNGLGSKGALWAPSLAERWVARLRNNATFADEADVRRFVKR